MLKAGRALLLFTGLALGLSDCRLGYEHLGSTGGESGASASEGGDSNGVSLSGQGPGMSDGGTTEVAGGGGLALGGESVGGQPSDAGSPGQGGGAQPLAGAGGSAAGAEPLDWGNGWRWQWHEWRTGGQWHEWRTGGQRHEWRTGGQCR